MIKGIGVPVITDYELWKNNPEKVLGLTGEAQGADEGADATYPIKLEDGRILIGTLR